MLKQLAASHAAKSIALCVCPVVGAGVVATKVPKVRRMVHEATAPKEKPRARRALANARDPQLPCANPVVLANGPVPRTSFALPAAVGLPEAETAVVPSAAPTQGGVLPVGNGFAPVALPGGFGGIGGGGVGLPGGGIGGGPGGGGTLAPVNPPVIGEPPRGSNAGGVPEPETWLQLTVGFAALGVTTRFVQRKRESRSA